MPRTHQTFRRLYVEPGLAPGIKIVLGASPANHLRAVLRKRAGDELIVFNGRDGAFLAVITRFAKNSVELAVGEQTAAQTPPSSLWYGFAPLKTARLDYVVQKATEMGAGIIQPVITQFTQSSRVNLDKMRANAIGAAEQCEVLSVPRIAEPVRLDALITTWPQRHGGARLVFADEGETAPAPNAAIAGLAGAGIGLLIGPEGGFSVKERSLLRAQSFVTPISLGPRILRADTAAVAALTLIQSIIGDWR